MTAHPHNISDLHLAPLALALDNRIDELGALSPANLAHQVALLGDKPERTRQLRETGLLSTISRTIELHDWQLGQPRPKGKQRNTPLHPRDPTHLHPIPRHAPGRSRRRHADSDQDGTCQQSRRVVEAGWDNESGSADV